MEISNSLIPARKRRKSKHAVDAVVDSQYLLREITNAMCKVWLISHMNTSSDGWRLPVVPQFDRGVDKSLSIRRIPTGLRVLMQEIILLIRGDKLRLVRFFLKSNSLHCKTCLLNRK